mgnify:CR=1 FL=1
MIMELSNRLETIASFVTEGYVVADIGTDHGYIPIYLTSNGNCPRAYAMDVNKEPLSRAKTHIEEENWRVPTIMAVKTTAHSSDFAR